MLRRPFSITRVDAAGTVFEDCITPSVEYDDGAPLTLAYWSGLHYDAVVPKSAVRPSHQGLMRIQSSATAGIKRKVPDELAPAPSSTRCDLEAAMAHTSNVLELLEGSIGDLNAALLHQATILQKLPPKAKAREEALQHMRDVCDQVQTLVKSVKVPAVAHQVKVPLDHRVRETTTMPKRETNLVPESHIQDGQKTFFHEQFTTSVNQREENVLGGKAKMRKVRPVTAGIHWLQFRRFLGILNLTDASGPPVAVVDVLTEENVARACKHFENERNLDGNRFAVATIRMYARMWSAMGKCSWTTMHRSRSQQW